MKKRLRIIGLAVFVGVLIATRFVDALHFEFGEMLGKEVGRQGLMRQNFGAMYLPFLENKGQISNSSVKFIANNFFGTTFITDNSLIYSVVKKDSEKQTKLAFREIFLDQNGISVILNPQGQELQNVKVTDIRNQNIQNWKSKIRTYNKVDLGNIWPGINVYLQNRDVNFEKFFEVQPHANINNIKILLSGIENITKNNGTGELNLQTSLGNLALSTPVAKQGDKKINVEYVVLNNNTYGFTIKDSQYDPNLPLVIDPLLGSTFVGASGDENNPQVAVDSSGNIFVVGTTGSTDFPASTLQTTYGGGTSDIFVAKFSSDLTTLQSAAFIGGSSDETSPIISIDSSDKVFVAGVTNSANFPSGSTAAGGDDIFVLKLNNSLSTLEDSVRMGGSGQETINDIAFNGTNIFIAGTTRSSDLPLTSGTYDSTFNGTEVVFVSKLSATLDSPITTSLGNSNEKEPKIAFDSSNNIFIAGTTDATNFPTNPATTGDTKPFVAKMDNNLVNLIGTPYLINSTSASAVSLLVDSSDIVFVANGQSNYQNIKISKLSNNLSLSDELDFAGTNPDNRSPKLIIDGAGDLVLAGITSTQNVITPTAGVYDDSYNTTGSDIFLVKLATSDLSTIAATFLGNTVDLVTVAVNSAEEIIIVGVTNDADSVPLATNAYDDSLSAQDVFVVKLDANLTANQAPTFSSVNDVNLAATPVNGGATITWSTAAFSDPDEIDGDKITGYKILYGTSSGTYSLYKEVAGKDVATTDITGLTNGTTYYFEIVAYDIEGLTSNQTGSPVSAIPANAAPTWDNVSAISSAANNGSIDLDWSPGADDDVAVASYRIEWGTDISNLNNNATVSGTITTYTIAGPLAGGVDYYIKVYAIDDDLEETAKSAPFVSMPNNAPNKINNLVLDSVGDGTITISWDQGSNADNNLTGYEIRYSNFPSDFDNASNSIPINNTTTTTATISGLTNGTPYFITVAGVDSTSTYGEPADQIAATPTTSTSNSAPGNMTISAQAQDGQVAVSWSAVTDPDGNLDGYRIYYSTTENYFVNYEEVGEAATDVIITGLTNGTQYYFVGRAYDTNSTFSVNESNKVTATPTAAQANVAPTAPSNLQGTGGNSAVTLTWDASADSDGTVVGYRVYYGTTSGSLNLYYPASGTITGTTTTVTGLTNQQVYYFAVKAVDNDDAWSALSTETAVQAAGDNHAPTTPNPLTAVADNQSVTLSWGTSTDPDYNLAGYKVYYGTTSGTYTEETGILTNTSLTITGLTNGTTYYFIVKAIDENAVLSDASNLAQATPSSSVISSFSVSNFIATADQRVVSENLFISGRIAGVEDINQYTFGVEVTGELEGIDNVNQTVQGTGYLLSGNVFSKNLVDVVKETYPGFTTFELGKPIQVRITLQNSDAPTVSIFQTGSQTFTPNTAIESLTSFSTGSGTYATITGDIVIPVSNQIFTFPAATVVESSSTEEEDLNVVIPTDTIISKSPTYFNTWSGEFEAPRKITTPTPSEAVFYGGFTPINGGTITFGFEHLRLLFSKAVTVHIPIDEMYNSQTLNIFTSQDGVVWTAAYQCTVLNGICGFNTTYSGRFAIGTGYVAPPTPPGGSIAGNNSAGVSRYRGMGGGNNKKRHGGYDPNNVNIGYFGAPYTSTVTIKPEKIVVRSLCNVPDDYYVTRGLYSLIGLITKEEILCQEEAIGVVRKDLKTKTRDICTE